MVETAMAFFREEVLGNYLAGVLVAGSIWAAGALRRRRTRRPRDTDCE
ncbi:hypothetical protein ACFW91_25885 [Streptomyces asoensis]